MAATVTGVRATFERIKALRERDSVAQQMYDDTLAKRDSAEAELDAVQREIGGASVALQQAEDDLEELFARLADSQGRHLAKVDRTRRTRAGRAAGVRDHGPLARPRGLRRFRHADQSISRSGRSVAVTADAFPGEHFAGQVTKIAAGRRSAHANLRGRSDDRRAERPEAGHGGDDHRGQAGRSGADADDGRAARRRARRFHRLRRGRGRRPDVSPANAASSSTASTTIASGWSRASRARCKRATRSSAAALPHCRRPGGPRARRSRSGQPIRQSIGSRLSSRQAAAWRTFVRHDNIAILRLQAAGGLDGAGGDARSGAGSPIGPCPSGTIRSFRSAWPRS